MKFISLCFVNCFLWKGILEVSSKPTTNETKNYGGLIKYLKEDSKLHQVIFILDDSLNHTDPAMNSLTEAVSVNFPTLSITYKEMSSNIRERYMKLFELSRRTTLFVLQYQDGRFREKLFDTLNLIKIFKKLSPPRCLIVASFSSTDEHMNTLHSFWESKYLDVTVLSHATQGQVLQRKSKLHHLSRINPFTKRNFSQVLSSKSQWFPNKLQNLNGYELAFGFQLTSPSTVNVDFTHYDLETKINEIMTQAMNFVRNLYSEEYESLTYSLYDSESIFASVSPNLPIQNIGGMKAVIPNKAKFTKGIVVPFEFWCMIIATIVMIAIIRLAVFLMKLNRSAWQMWNIIQIIMGIPNETEPENLSGRIVFGSILITCLVYSGYLYSVFLDISWRKEPEISSLEELSNSALTPIMIPSMTMTFNTISYIKELIIKGQRPLESKDIIRSPNDCFEYLTKYQNVTCIIPNAEYYVNKYKAKNEELNVKILSETVIHYTSEWMADDQSPYIDRYKEVIQIAMETGLLKDFEVPDAKFQKTLPPEEIAKDTLDVVLLYVAVIGYSLSTIVFLLEMFVSNYKSYE